MRKVVSNQKGFTLVELAIVLIVIGLILGMVIKGRSLIDSAKAKSEIAKVQKIQAAVAAYYDKFNRLPGDRNNNGVIDYRETANAVRDLSNQGLISVSDFRIGIGRPGYYSFYPCDFDPNTNQMRGGTSTCIYPVQDPGLDPNISDSWSWRGSPKLWCILEVGMDDKNLLGGNIRQWMGSAPRFRTPLARKTGIGDCDSESGNVSGLEMIKIW